MLAFSLLVSEGSLREDFDLNWPPDCSLLFENCGVYKLDFGFLIVGLFKLLLKPFEIEFLPFLLKLTFKALIWMVELMLGKFNLVFSILLSCSNWSSSLTITSVGKCFSVFKFASRLFYTFIYYAIFLSFWTIFTGVLVFKYCYYSFRVSTKSL